MCPRGRRHVLGWSGRCPAGTRGLERQRGSEQAFVYRRALCVVEAAPFRLVTEVFGSPSAAPHDQLPSPLLSVLMHQE